MGSGREVRERNTKSQTPSSREIPNFKFQNLAQARFLGAWDLELLWSLVFGALIGGTDRDPTVRRSACSGGEQPGGFKQRRRQERGQPCPRELELMPEKHADKAVRAPFLIRPGQSRQGAFKKVSEQGRGRPVPVKHRAADTTRGRSRPRPILERTAGSRKERGSQWAEQTGG